MGFNSAFKVLNPVKMCPAEGDIFHAEGQKGMTKLILSFHNLFRGNASRLLFFSASVLSLLNINCDSFTPPPCRLTDNVSLR